MSAQLAGRAEDVVGISSSAVRACRNVLWCRVVRLGRMSNVGCEDKVELQVKVRKAVMSQPVFSAQRQRGFLATMQLQCDRGKIEACSQKAR